MLRAAAALPAEVQLVLCAGVPDTPEIMTEVQELVRSLQRTRDGVLWIERMLPRQELSAILTAATTFVCPSIYEPLGIVNLEAMACGAAVVGTATGGTPEVVADGEPDGSCRSDRSRTAPGRRSTWSGSSPTSPPCSPR